MPVFARGGVENDLVAGQRTGPLPLQESSGCRTSLTDPPGFFHSALAIKLNVSKSRLEARQRIIGVFR
jgi:hypothetical protein